MTEPAAPQAVFILRDLAAHDAVIGKLTPDPKGWRILTTDRFVADHEVEYLLERGLIVQFQSGTLAKVSDKGLEFLMEPWVDAWLEAQIEKKARELCAAAGGNPDRVTALTLMPPHHREWMHFKTKAAEALASQAS